MMRQTHCTPSYITFLQLPKSITFCIGLVNFSEGDVHEVIAIDQVPVECFPIFELY